MQHHAMLNVSFSRRKKAYSWVLFSDRGRGGASQKGGNGPILPYSLGPQTCSETCYQGDQEGTGLFELVASPPGHGKTQGGGGGVSPVVMNDRRECSLEVMMSGRPWRPTEE